jgi:hypothetical protein
MGIENPVPPTLLRVHPGDEVKLQIVANQRAMQCDRGGSHGGGYQDPNRTGESSVARRANLLPDGWPDRRHPARIGNEVGKSHVQLS